MTVSRRDFLRLAGLVASGATLAACSPVYTRLADHAQGSFSTSQITARDFSILRRLTYGPGQYELAKAAASGLPGWIEDQLNPDGVEENSLTWRLRTHDFLSLDADALSNREKDDLIGEFKQTTLIRKIYSRRQLFELMVEFWTDHFNIALAKGDCWFLKIVDDREVIRAHALGNFHDLLWASAHSPAMLVYLDNQANHRDAPNENYARELLELHTIGINGGYQQQDVMALARSLTGWTVKDHFWRGQFTFDADRHDMGRKKLFGKTIEPGGIEEAEQVITQLATHPATAHHIATKLVRRFITDDPLSSQPGLVTEAAETFIQTRGDIKAVLRTILLDGLLQDDRGPAPKYRRPADYVVAGLRAVDAETNGGAPLQTYLARMGHALFDWPTPDGPPDLTQAWMGNLLPRWQFAVALARDDIPGTTARIHDLLPGLEAETPEGQVDALSLVLLGAQLAAGPRARLVATLEQARAVNQAELPGIILAGLLASPAFQWR